MQTVRKPKTNRESDAHTRSALGLRERKKRETRKAIADAAIRLFDRQGFQNTTIAQIAAAADVAPRTVSSYFPVKEELALPDQRKTMQGLYAHLTDRPPRVTALEALRTWIEESMSRWEKDAEEMHLSRRVIDAEPELRAYERAVMGEIVDVLRLEFARDLGRDEDDLEPRMAAAATMAVFEVLGDHFKQGPEPVAEELRPELRAEVGAQIDHAVRFIAAGIEALDAPAD